MSCTPRPVASFYYNTSWHDSLHVVDTCTQVHSQISRPTVNESHMILKNTVLRRTSYPSVMNKVGGGLELAVKWSSANTKHRFRSYSTFRVFGLRRLEAKFEPIFNSDKLHVVDFHCSKYYEKIFKRSWVRVFTSYLRWDRQFLHRSTYIRGESRSNQKYFGLDVYCC